MRFMKMTKMYILFKSIIHQFFILNRVCTGGELFDKIVEENHFTETKAAIVFKQIL